MSRVFALVVALTYVFAGSWALVLFGFALEMSGGGDTGDWLVFAGFAIYIYGVAAIAFWHAARPFSHGFVILLALCSPVALLLGVLIMSLAVANP